MPVAAPGDESTAECTVTRETIAQFAEITGDDNPPHVDEAYASEGVFGEPVAHGVLTAGVVSAALADLPGDIVSVEQTLDFEAPVSPGSTAVAGCEVLDVVHDDRFACEPPPASTATAWCPARPSCSRFPTTPEPNTLGRVPDAQS